MNKVCCYLWIYELISLDGSCIACAVWHITELFLLFFFVFFYFTEHVAARAVAFFLQVTSFDTLFVGVFQAFLPSFCAAVCQGCAGLVCTLYTGGLCAFPCLSPCSHSNLLPESLLLPFSAWPVVAMPPHHTVIVWSSMATMIRGCRETVYMLGSSFSFCAQSKRYWQ